MSYVSNVEPVACSVSKKANAVLIHEPARLTDGETAASERGESLIPRALCDVERHVVDPLSVAVQVLLEDRWAVQGLHDLQREVAHVSQSTP